MRGTEQDQTLPNCADGAGTKTPAGDPESSSGRGCIPNLSVTERAVYGASISLAPRLGLNIPSTLACSHRGGLKAALPGANNSRMHPAAGDDAINRAIGRHFC